MRPVTISDIVELILVVEFGVIEVDSDGHIGPFGLLY